MGEHYAASWWEKGFFIVIGREQQWADDRRHTKRFIDSFSDNIGGFDDLLYMTKKVILSDEYDNFVGMQQDEMDATIAERAQIQDCMKDLANEVKDHLLAIARPPRRGALEPDDYDEQAACEKIRRSADNLRQAYDAIPDMEEDGSRPRERLRNQLGCLVFSVLCYSTQIMDTFEKETEQKLEETNELENFMKYVKDTFGERILDEKGEEVRYDNLLVKYWYDLDKKMFVGRNFVSIGTCFVMGNFLKGNVFDGFNANMATTLAILISHFPGTAFETNLTRLLGLTLGKVLPIIIMAVVSVVGSKSRAATLVHLAMIWFYESFFAFM